MIILIKDDIELVTEFPCFLGHPVAYKFVRKGIESLSQTLIF